jgi:hypothetical protein
MMSKERELLKKALDFMLDAGANLNPLFKEINDNLLVQPEQEPLSYEDIRSIVNQLPAEVDLRVGVEFCRIIEKAHGIKREPLSEDQVSELLMSGFSTHLMDLVRMVEKAHGIGVGE